MGRATGTVAKGTTVGKSARTKLVEEFKRTADSYVGGGKIVTTKPVGKAKRTPGQDRYVKKVQSLAKKKGITYKAAKKQIAGKGDHGGP